MFYEVIHRKGLCMFLGIALAIAGLVVGFGGNTVISKKKLNSAEDSVKKELDKSKKEREKIISDAKAEADTIIETAKKEEVQRRKEIKEIEILKAEVTAHIQDFEFHLAAEKLYHYIWHRLADEIIEQEKERQRSGSAESLIELTESYALLEYLLLESLKMLHPFMPFITEEIWQIFRPGTMLMVEHW